MGTEEASPVSRRRMSAIAACAVFALLAFGGCGDEDTAIDENATLGPVSPEGDIEASRATLHPEDGYTTLASAQIETRGDKDTLVVAQVEVEGSTDPDLRLKVDGKAEKNARVETLEQEGGRVALVSCACEFETGEHAVVLEGGAGATTAQVGARTLVVFPEVDLDDTGGDPVNGNSLVTEPVAVDPEGATLAKTPTTDPGGGTLIVIGSTAAPRSGVGSESVRTEVLVGGETTGEIARTTIPGGRLVAYLDDDGAGKEVEMRGFTTDGTTPVGVSSLIACACGLAR